jgi:hypothetical protein
MELREIALDNFYYLREKLTHTLYKLSSKGQKSSAFNNFLRVGNLCSL